METPTVVAEKREVCRRCQRPLRACYCAALPATPLQTRRTRVVVVQHANEQRQRHAISSVPVLAQVLASPTSVHMVPVSPDTADVSGALCRTLHDELDRVVLAESVEAVLVLFPHADAQTLTARISGESLVSADSRSSGTINQDKTVVLVVVDGTWHEAKKIVHHSRPYWESVARDRRGRGKAFEYVCLDAAASVQEDAFSPSTRTTTSIYGELRKEPMDGCVSTLEAVALALRVLEPESLGVCDALCAAFQTMVSIQTSFLQRGRAQQQAKHGGTPKPKSGSIERDRIGSQDQAGGNRQAAGQGIVRPYVLYTTQTDFRTRQRLVQEGDVHVCTRDDAIAMCHAMNRTRPRGSRVSSLPQEAFTRQQLQYERLYKDET